LNEKLIQCAPNAPHQTGISIDYLSSISLRALMPPRIRGAIDQIELAGMGTFGPWIALALRSLTAGITYRDPKHQNHNGQEVEIVLRNQGDKKKMKIFRLRLVLDDQKNPLEQARFESDGDSGSIALNIHQPKKTEWTKEEKDQLINSLSDAELADILHHEGMHMLHYWQRKYGKEYLPFSGVSQAILGLSDVESKQTTKLIEKNLRTIFDVVNENRRQKKVPLVPYSRAIDFAQRLTEEAMVRGETQFMGKMQERRGQARTMGIGRVQTGLSELSGPIDRATPEAYLFEFGDMLTLQDLKDLKAAGDKAADANDALKKIAIVFNGLIETHLELRYRTVEAIEMKP
jgi:hypothetical protein